MSNNYVQVPPDSTGKKMQTFENTVSGNTVEAEAVVLVRSSDNTEIGTSGQALRIDPTGTTVQPVSGTVTATQATGTNLHMVIDSGTLTTVSTVTAVTAITNALPAGTNVIGHVITDSGSTTAVTGSVTVVQATGTNLHVVVDSGTISAVTAITNALPTGSNIIGKVDILGSLGVALDAVLGATKPANVLQVGGNDGTNAYAIPLASGGGSVVVSGSVTIAPNSSVNLAQVNGVTTLTGAGASGTGAQRVTVSQDTTTIAGSAPGTAGSASTNVISIQGVAGMTPVQTTTVPATSGGLSLYHVVSAGSTNAANIKASAGQVYGVSIYNAATYPVYVKLYNTAGTPTAGTGVIQTFGCQAGTETNIQIAAGIPYATGIGITITKGIADNDGTAVLANDCVVEVYYK